MRKLQTHFLGQFRRKLSIFDSRLSETTAIFISWDLLSRVKVVLWYFGTFFKFTKGTEAILCTVELENFLLCFNFESYEFLKNILPWKNCFQFISKIKSKQTLRSFWEGFLIFYRFTSLIFQSSFASLKLWCPCLSPSMFDQHIN